MQLISWYIPPWYKDGFVYQTGVGGASIASTKYLAEHLRKDNIHIGVAMGGIAQAICELQHEGLIDKIADTQDFDMASIEDIKTNPNH